MDVSHQGSSRNSSRTIQIPKGGCHQGFAFIMSANLEDPAMATGLEKVNPQPNSQKKKVKESEVTQSCPTLATPWTTAHQAPLSMRFSRQEYWSGLPFPSPGDLPNPGIEPGSPTLQADALTSELLGKQECPNHRIIALISHASKVMLKILNGRLQHYVN